MGERLKREGVYVYLFIIHIVVLEREMTTHSSILACKIPWMP